MRGDHLAIFPRRCFREQVHSRNINNWNESSAQPSPLLSLGSILESRRRLSLGEIESVFFRARKILR